MKDYLRILGPCSVQDRKTYLDIGDKLVKLMEGYNNWYYKASFDKANRTSIYGGRGPGMEESIDLFYEIKEKYPNIKLTTDIHEPWQAKAIEPYVDIIQIPAYLCRQTDLLVAAGETGRTVNIKKGQFVSGKNMIHAIDKVRATGNRDVMLTERGSMFGMGDLVVDFRQIIDMKELDVPVIIDCTHSMQQPNSGDTTNGNPEYAIHLAKAAKALGVDGYFFEIHPKPEQAWSDGSNMIQLDKFDDMLKAIAN